MAGVSAGAVGGASGELGSGHRAGAVAFLVVHGLLGREVEGLFPAGGAGSPEKVRLETDDPTDDVVCETTAGRKAWIQAKHQVSVGNDGAGLAPVVDQWARSISEGSVRPGDALVLAVGGAHLTGPMVELRDALRRRRDPNSGNLTVGQQGKLDILRRQIKCKAPYLDYEATTRLLDAAVVWHVDAADAENCDIGKPVDSQHAQLGAALLGAVYAPDSCPRAMAVLTGAARSLARLRTGSITHEWFEVLRAAKIAAIESPGDFPAARLVARDRALKRYRYKLVADAKELSLSNLGMPVAKLLCPGLAEGIRVVDATRGEASPYGLSALDGRALIPALRRRGRTLLKGLPGSGKSVALTQVAATWATADCAPVPIYVRLQDISTLIRRGRPLKIDNRLLASVGAGDYSNEDRDLLVEELADQLDKGSAMVLLDGLDECRENRHVVAEALRAWLTGAHSDTDLVVTTRDSAYSSARILDLPELAMCEPADLDVTLRRLLDHLADAVPETESRAEWIAARRAWLDQARAGGEDFWKVPLFAVMLVLNAAHRSLQTLPSTRAATLYQTIEDVTRHWEARYRQGDLLGVFNGRLAEDVLIDTFAVLGHALAATGELPQAAAKLVVESRLREHYHRPPGEASSHANVILELWDEAGVFVETSAGTVVARARLFTEVATAVVLRGLPDQEQCNWIRDHIEDAGWHNTLELAAELSSQLGSIIARIAATSSDPFAGLLLCRARRRGADVDLDQMISVWGRLVELVPTISNLKERWELTRALAMEPLPCALHAQALLMLLEAAPERATIIKALAAANWDLEPQDNEWRRSCLVAMLTAPQPPGLGMPPGTRVSALAVDPDYSQAVVVAAKALVPEFPEYVSLVVDATEVIGSGMSWDLRQYLVDQGYWQALQAGRDKREGGGASIFDQVRSLDFWQGWLGVLPEVGARGDISRSQAWHLDEFAAVVAVMKISQSPSYAVPQASRDHAVNFARLTLATARCVGLDSGAIVSQAVELSSMSDSDISELLLRNPPSRDRIPLLKPECVADEAPTLIEIINNGSVWMQGRAARLLSAHAVTDARERRFDELEQKVRSFAPRTQYLVADAILAGSDSAADARLSRFAQYELPTVRAAAAASAATRIVAGDESLQTAEIADRLAIDPDAEVRSVLIGATTMAVRREIRTHNTLSKRLVERVNNLIARVLSPALRWSCAVCGRTNAIESEACVACSVVGPELELDCEKLGKLFAIEAE